VIASLVDRLPFKPPAEQAVFFLCGADLPHDIDELAGEVLRRGWSSANTVDNDTFALLHAGTDRPDAIAVVCGSGINCVGRNAAGRVSRFPMLGWETGDWGGAEALGREALIAANRAADGRGEATALVDLIEGHFGKPVVAVGEDVHYRRMRDTRLGELGPRIVELASDDVIARSLVRRLVDEIVLLVERARRDLDVVDADLVLGGGMLAPRGPFFELVAGALPSGMTPVVPELPPVAGAVLAALEGDAAVRFRAAFEGWEPRG
jgi:N-acetylglucosamine kinase-like BadF-type ATPase